MTDYLIKILDNPFFETISMSNNELKKYIQIFSSMPVDDVKSKLLKEPGLKKNIDLWLTTLEMSGENGYKAFSNIPNSYEDSNGFRFDEKGHIVSFPKSFYDELKKRYLDYKEFFDKYLN